MCIVEEIQRYNTKRNVTQTCSTCTCNVVICQRNNNNNRNNRNK